ncbi:hypothetical protein FDZ71_04875, partial [bacterium]
MIQNPSPGAQLVRFAGDIIEVTLRARAPEGSLAFLRTTVGGASIRRGEIIRNAEDGDPRLDREWRDLPMAREADGHFKVLVPLAEVGVFFAKAFILAPDGGTSWPEGGNIRIKVNSSEFALANTIYSSFVRQHGFSRPDEEALKPHVDELEASGYTVIPPSGTFREFAERIPFVVETLGFRIIQLLPVHPVPPPYGRMGRFGSPFAALDFMDVDSSLAQFDRRTTPLDQLRELIDRAHSLDAKIFLDIPVNHTGWASWLQIHNPQWFERSGDSFLSPGAWGVVWSDLSKLDYSDKNLWRYMAGVFLWWARMGVDGFRCDAGYMVPLGAWEYMVAKVREEFPDTLFFLEGLGGPVRVMESLLFDAGLDWAYSELFQNYSRNDMAGYIPWADGVSRSAGPLIHFAETHDNDRLAARGVSWSRLRTAICAFSSQFGGFGAMSGSEWLCKKKIKVHEAVDLDWGSTPNLVDWFARINLIISTHPAFVGEAKIAVLPSPSGANSLLVRREGGGEKVLALFNLDTEKRARVSWRAEDFPFEGELWDLLSDEAANVGADGRLCSIELDPGGSALLTANMRGWESDVKKLVDERRLRAALLRVLPGWGLA